MLSLGSPSGGGIPEDGPEAATWTGPSDYVAGVVAAVETWLSKRDMPARTRLVPARSQDHADQLGRIALAVERDMIVEPLRTMRDDWLDALACIERYVALQNALFRAEESLREEGMVVASPLMRATVARVVEAASTSAGSVLLLGPSGSGKEGLARCFHRHARRAGPFIARNCAMFSRDLLRSELFGAEKGAFTSSTRRIVGAVETAHEGTLFLDEIGELPADIQPMLLRFLDRGEYEPIGLYGQTRRADVRLVCATNRDLRAGALSGDFRLDLWFRLSVHVIEVPPLGQRYEDILAYLGSRLLKDGRTLLDALDPDALALLRGHTWHGNFRELNNFAERITPLANQGRVAHHHCERLLAEGSVVPIKRGSVAPGAPAGSETEWTALWGRAAAAFAEDHSTSTPRTWDDVKDYIESYLKPVIFAHLSGSEQLKARGDIDLSTLAKRVNADRGTAGKQIERFLSRFVK